MIYAGILYVLGSCAASKRLLGSTRLGEAQIFVQYVDDLQPEDVPEWLDGTPLLVETASGSVTRGSARVKTVIAALTSRD
jgi:hypothetical protein